MRPVEACVVCGHTDLIAIPTRIAPFLSEYIWGAEPDIACRLMICRRCTVAFYNYRFDPPEIQTLYNGYRGEAYARIREKHEPGYLELNKQTGAGKEITARRANLDAIICEAAQSRTVTRVLDYGGDAGQFIPDCYSDKRRFVYDLSGVPLIKGVEAIADPLGNAPYDFVMCAHVLEHSPDPVRLGEELARLVTDEGLIYIEVPWDPCYFNHKLRYARFPKWEPPLLHEHITFFTATALRQLAARIGLSVVYCKVRYLDIGWAKTRVISMLASRKPSDRASTPNRGMTLASEFGLWMTSKVGEKASALVHRN